MGIDHLQHCAVVGAGLSHQILLQQEALLGQLEMGNTVGTVRHLALAN